MVAADVRKRPWSPVAVALVVVAATLVVAILAALLMSASSAPAPDRSRALDAQASPSWGRITLIGLSLACIVGASAAGAFVLHAPPSPGPERPRPRVGRRMRSALTHIWPTLGMPPPSDRLDEARAARAAQGPPGGDSAVRHAERHPRPHAKGHVAEDRHPDGSGHVLAPLVALPGEPEPRLAPLQAAWDRLPSVRAASRRKARPRLHDDSEE